MWYVLRESSNTSSSADRAKSRSYYRILDLLDGNLAVSSCKMGRSRSIFSLDLFICLAKFTFGGKTSPLPTVAMRNYG